jgi:hypothetical protein
VIYNSQFTGFYQCGGIHSAKNYFEEENMKNVFRKGAAILFIAAAFALVSCSNTLEVSDDSNVVLAIPGPANVKATAYDGAILVGWDPVKDATSYQVYRKDVKTGAVKLVRSVTAGSSNYVLDIVGYENYLVDGEKYVYTVVSESGTTVGAIVWNGQSSSNTVEATIPTSLVATVSNLNVTKVGSLAYVTWESNNAQGTPNFSDYDVVVTTTTLNGSYSFAAAETGAVSGINQPNTDELARYFNKKHGANFALPGGTFTVTVTPKWGNGYNGIGTAVSKNDVQLSPALHTTGNNSVTGAAVNIDPITKAITVTWNTDSLATSYDVYRAKGSISNPTTAWAIPTGGGNLADPSFTDATVEFATEYAYLIIAKDGNARTIIGPTSGANLTAYDLSNAGVGALTAPSTPSAARVAETPTSVQVTWGFVPNATSYDVYRAEFINGTQGSDWLLLGNATVTTYTETGVAVGKDYRYSVIAKKGSLVSGRSNTSAALANNTVNAPTSPTAVRVAGTPTSVEVKWGIALNVSGYEVFRAEYNGSAQLTDFVKLGDSTTVTYTDTAAAINTSYRYRIYATNGTVRSSYVDTLTIAGLTVTGGGALTVTRASWTTNAPAETSDVLLSWGAVSGATSYKVYRSEFTGYTTLSDGNSVTLATALVNLGAWTELTGTPTTTGSGTYYLKDAALPSNKNYVYKLQTLNGAIVSEEPTSGYFLRAVDPSLTISSTGLTVANERGNPNTITGATLNWLNSIVTGTASGWIFEYAEVEGTVPYFTYSLSGLTVKTAWTSAGTPAVNAAGDGYTVDVAGLALDKAYAFRIAATNTAQGLQSGYAYRYVGKHSMVASPSGITPTTSETPNLSTGRVSYELQFAKREPTATYNVQIETWAPSGIKVTSGAELPTVTHLQTASPAEPVYELWRITDLRVRYTYTYVITETFGGVTSTVNTTDLNTGFFGNASVLGQQYPTLLNTAGGSLTAPTGVTGAYQIAVRVDLSGTSYYNDLSFDVYRVRKADNGTNIPYDSPTDLWEKLNTTPIPYETNLAYTGTVTNPAAGVYSSGSYWYYNDVRGEANVGKYYSYYVVVHSSILPAGNDIIATGVQAQTTMRPSTGYVNAFIFGYTFPNFGWSYTSEGVLDNEVSLRLADPGYYADAKNAKLYWVVTGAGDTIESPIAGTIARHTAANAAATVTAGNRNTDDLYIDLARPAASLFTGAFVGADRRSIWIGTRAVNGDIQPLIDTKLEVVYDGTSSYTIEGRFGAVVSLGTPALSNTAAGLLTAPTGVTGAYSVRVRLDVYDNIDYASNLSFDVYRSEHNGNTTTSLLGIPYSSGYFSGGYWYYNDTVGEAGLGNTYDYYVVARSTLIAGDNIIATSSQSSSWTQLSTAVSLLSNFDWSATTSGYLDNEVTLRTTGAVLGNGFYAEAKNARLYWYVAGSNGVATVPIGQIDRIGATPRGADTSVGTVAANQLYIDLTRPTASAFKDAFTDGSPEIKVRIFIATKDVNGSYIPYNDTSLDVEYSGTATKPNTAFTITGRWDGITTLLPPDLFNTPSGTLNAPTGVTGAYKIAVRVLVSSIANPSALSFDLYRNTVKVNNAPIPVTSGYFDITNGYWYYNDDLGEPNIGNSYYYSVVARSSLLPADNDIIAYASGNSSTEVPSTPISGAATYLNNLLTGKVRSADTISQVGYYLQMAESSNANVLKGAKLYMTPRYNKNGGSLPIANPIPVLVGTVAYTTTVINSIGDITKVDIPANSYYVVFDYPVAAPPLELPIYVSGVSDDETFQYYVGAKTSNASGISGLSFGASALISIEARPGNTFVVAW